jgi:hypothetical protein
VDGGSSSNSRGSCGDEDGDGIRVLPDENLEGGGGGGGGGGGTSRGRWYLPKEQQNGAVAIDPTDSPAATDEVSQRGSFAAADFAALSCPANKRKRVESMKAHANSKKKKKRKATMKKQTGARHQQPDLRGMFALQRFRQNK